MEDNKNTKIFLGLSVVLAISLIASLIYAANIKSSLDDATKVVDDGRLDYAQFVTLPEEGYKNLTTDLTIDEVTEADIDTAFDEFMANFVSYEDADENETVEEGDIVSISYTIDNSEGSLSVEGVVGSEDLPSEFSSVLIGLSVGEGAVVDLSTSEIGHIYYVMVEHISKPVETSDEYIASLGISDVSTIEELRQNLKGYLEAQNLAVYKSNVAKDFLAQLYNTSTFSAMPSDYIQPFINVLKARLDNAVKVYAEQGQEVTYDDILASVYESDDSISDSNDYLNIYGLQNAKTYALCEKIATLEDIEPTTTSIYSIAASDWANAMNSYNDLETFLDVNDISVYERSALQYAVEDFLYEINMGDTESVKSSDSSSESSAADSSLENSSDVSDKSGALSSIDVLEESISNDISSSNISLSIDSADIDMSSIISSIGLSLND